MTASARDLHAGQPITGDIRAPEVVDVDAHLQNAALPVEKSRPVAAAIGFVALALVLLMAIFGPMVAPHNPVKPNPAAIGAGVSWDHLMGTDQYGRDVFSRVLHAARLDVRIAISITLLALAAGSFVGAIVGFYGGFAENVVMRVIDVLLAFPGFILALGITAMLGNSTKNVIIAVAIAYFPYFVRIVRGEMLALREAEFAAAARVVGVRRFWIMVYHLLPNALPPALVQATLTLGWGILDAAGLSFLGVGIRPPTPEWGVMIGDGAQYVNSGKWWMSIFPGIMVLIAVLGFNLTGDWVRDRVERR